MERKKELTLLTLVGSIGGALLPVALLAIALSMVLMSGKRGKSTF